MQYNCVTNEVHIVAPLRCCLNAVRHCSTKLRASTAMDVFAIKEACFRRLLSLLKAEFVDAEKEYQHTDVDTDQEEDTEEREEDASVEEKNSDEEDDHDLALGELVETEASFNDQSEQAIVEQLLRESYSCQLGPDCGACSSAVSKGATVLTRNNFHQMARKELDLVVMAQINALKTPADHRGLQTTCSNEVLHPRHRSVPKSIFVHAISRTCFKSWCYR